jgi:hypothetical protein
VGESGIVVFRQGRRTLATPAMARFHGSHLFVATALLFAFFSSVRRSLWKGETVQTKQDAPTELIFR